MTTSPRQRILDVADELFYGQGIRAVGVDTIVARSGAAKTTLYAHFGSKDELVAAYLDARSIRWRAHLSTQLELRSLSSRDRLLAVFDILGEGCAGPAYRGCPFINATAELADTTHPAQAVITEHRAWVRALLRDLAASAAPNPAEVAAELQLLYDAVLVTAQVEGGADPAQRARTMAAILVDARLPEGRALG